MTARVDCAWKFEKLRKSLQMPFSRRYEYPISALDSVAMERFAGGAVKLKRATKVNRRDSTSLNDTVEKELPEFNTVIWMSTSSACDTSCVDVLMLYHVLC